MTAEPRFSPSEFSRHQPPAETSDATANGEGRLDAELFEAVLRETMSASGRSDAQALVRRAFESSEAQRVDVTAAMSLVRTVIADRYRDFPITDTACRHVAELLVEDPKALEVMEQLWSGIRGHGH